MDSCAASASNFIIFAPPFVTPNSSMLLAIMEAVAELAIVAAVVNFGKSSPLLLLLALLGADSIEYDITIFWLYNYSTDYELAFTEMRCEETKQDVGVISLLVHEVLPI